MGAGKGTSKRVSSRQGDNWLHKNSEYRKVYRAKQSVANYELVLYKLDRKDDAPARYGVSVSKKVGNAVTRNKMRRVLDHQITETGVGEVGNDYVLVVRDKLVAAYEASGSNAVKKSLLDVHKKMKRS